MSADELKADVEGQAALEKYRKGMR